MNGNGIYSFKNGDVYVGEYRDNQKNGKGVYTRCDGESYNGHFRDGKKHGNGISIYKDGSYYNGKYRNGLKHGVGIHTKTYANGVINATFYEYYEGNIISSFAMK